MSLLRQRMIDAMTVGILQAAEIQHAQSLGLPPPNPIIFVEDRLLVGKKAQRHEASADALSRHDWEQLPAALASAQAVYWDAEERAFIYAMPPKGESAAVVAVRVSDKHMTAGHAPIAASAYAMKSALIKEKLLKGSYVKVR